MINSVLKAIDILQVFTPTEPRLTLGEISQRLDLPKSTTHDLLNTLLSRGLIEKTNEGEYALGVEILALTQSVRINVELRDVAAPLVRNLADTARETVNLMVRDGDLGLYLYAVESSHRLRARTAVGDRATLHATGVGKAILSCLSREEVEGIAQRMGLTRFTRRTVVDLDSLHGQLAAFRQQGYAVDAGEHEDGLFCIAAPIFNRKAYPIAACSIAGTDPEILGARQQTLAARVTYTAQEISRYMGYLPKPGANIAATSSSSGELDRNRLPGI